MCLAQQVQGGQLPFLSPPPPGFCSGRGNLLLRTPIHHNTINNIYIIRKPWVLTIYTNYPGGNPVHKHKTIKFEVVGEQPAIMYIQISWKEKKGYKNCIPSNHSACVLKALLKRNNENHLFFQPKFPDFSCKWYWVHLHSNFQGVIITPLVGLI